MGNLDRLLAEHQQAVLLRPKLLRQRLRRSIELLEPRRPSRHATGFARSHETYEETLCALLLLRCQAPKHLLRMLSDRPLEPTDRFVGEKKIATVFGAATPGAPEGHLEERELARLVPGILRDRIGHCRTHRCVNAG